MKNVKKNLLYVVIFMIGFFTYSGQVYAADATCIYEGPSLTYTFKINANDTGGIDFEFEYKKNDTTDRLTYNVTHNAVTNSFINTSTNKIMCPSQLYYKMTGGGTTIGVTLSFAKFDEHAQPIALSNESTNNNKVLETSNSILKSCMYSGTDAVSGNIVSEIHIKLTNNGLIFEATNGYTVTNIDPNNINTSTFTKDTDCNSFTTYISCGSSGSTKACSVSKTNAINSGTESSGSNTPSAENPNATQYSCSYKGQVSGNNLTITKVSNGSYQWIVNYPDGSTKEFTSMSNNSFPSSECEDVFYVKNNDDVKIMKIEANTFHTETYISQLCYGYGNEVEQFCQNGNCKISNSLCGSGTTTDDGENGSACPWELRAIIIFLKKVAFNTVQFFVPILLIVMGTIDFTKAVASSDDKGNKEAISKFIKRCLAAIMVFFIGTIVTIVMDMFAKTDTGEKNDWKTCWQSIE